jgi:hypothetical protein
MSVRTMIPHVDEQRRRLQNVISEAHGFGAILLFESGDPSQVSFLAPIYPELRGVEICSASPDRADGRIYDLWKDSKMISHGLTLGEVVDLIREIPHTKKEMRKNIARWTKDTMDQYGMMLVRGLH